MSWANWAVIVLTVAVAAQGVAVFAWSIAQTRLLSRTACDVFTDIGASSKAGARQGLENRRNGITSAERRQRGNEQNE